MPKQQPKPETADLPEKPEPVALPEVPSELVEIPFRDQVFTLPRDREDWPTKAIVALQQKQYGAVVEQLLGPGQWDVLNAIAPKYREFMEFLTVFGDVVSKECTGG